MKKKILSIALFLAVLLTCVFSACTFKQEDILTDKDTITSITLTFRDGISVELDDEQTKVADNALREINELAYDTDNLLQGQIKTSYDYTFKLTVERKKFLFFKEERTETFRFGTYLTHTDENGVTKEYRDSYEWCYVNNLRYTCQMAKDKAERFRAYFDNINQTLRKDKYDGVKDIFKNAGYAVSELTGNELDYVTNPETDETVWVEASEGFFAVKGDETYRFYLTNDLDGAQTFASKMNKYGGRNTGCLCGYGNVTDAEFLNTIYN